jgi:hypothetical protein
MDMQMQPVPQNPPGQTEFGGSHCSPGSMIPSPQTGSGHVQSSSHVRAAALGHASLGIAVLARIEIPSPQAGSGHVQSI